MVQGSPGVLRGMWPWRSPATQVPCPGGWLLLWSGGGSMLLFGGFQEGGLNNVIPTEGTQGGHVFLKFSCQVTDNACWDP